MINKIKNIALVVISILAIVFGILYFSVNTEKIIVKVPVKIDVPVPVKEFVYDTIIKPVPYIVEINNPLNEDLERQLVNSKTIIDSLKIYKDFAVKRKYSEVFDDSIQIIIVNAETTGTLDKLQATYKTKPRSIPIDIEVPVEINVPFKSKLFLGTELAMPLQKYDQINQTVIRNNLRVGVKAGLDTRNFIYSIGIDTDTYANLGIYYKF